MSNLKLTKEEYRNLFDDLERIVEVACESNECISCPLKRKGICIKADVEVGFEQLINEHFDNSVRIEEGKMFKLFKNKPLKFEELKEGMWVWDNLKKEYIQIEFLDKGIPGYKYLNAITVPSNEYERSYSNNRFYRREVKE